MRLRLTLILLLAAVAAGCDSAAAPERTPRAEQLQRARERAAMPPSVRAQVLERGEFIIIDAPVRPIGGQVERQTCFVWRDFEFKSASMQCPGDASRADFGEGPERDPAYRP
jgi:hypothetical protein